MMRLIFPSRQGCAASRNTRWPVSAACIAVSSFPCRAFRDEDDVRVLTQRATQRIGERPRVDADFPRLMMHLDITVQVFDRVLDGDHCAVRLG